MKDSSQVLAETDKKVGPIESKTVLGGCFLLNTYEVMDRIGEGAMSSVYRARHARTHGLVAVKVLRREVAAQVEMYRRFREEARTICALRHPHVVQVLDFNEDEAGNPFMVMEYLAGEDLGQRLKQRSCIPLREWLVLLSQVGSALQAAHERGVIHRDVKPQNVFLVRHPLLAAEVEVAKVLDFGIAKVRHALFQMTRDQTQMGTPHYMSPEVVAGQSAEADGRADQWALGVMTYRALSGRLPFDSTTEVGLMYQILDEDPPSLMSMAGMPAGVAAAVQRALAKDREKRFASVRDFVLALHEAAGLEGQLLPTGKAAGANLRRTGAWTPALACAALALGALGGWWVHAPSRMPDESSLTRGDLAPSARAASQPPRQEAAEEARSSRPACSPPWLCPGETAPDLATGEVKKTAPAPATDSRQRAKAKHLTWHL